jgi:hypothetical protein
MDDMLDMNFQQSISALQNSNFTEILSPTLLINMTEIIEDNLPEIDAEKVDEIIEDGIDIVMTVIIIVLATGLISTLVIIYCCVKYSLKCATCPCRTASSVVV